MEEACSSGFWWRLNAKDRFFSCWTYNGLDHILRDSLRILGEYWDGKKFG
jgi:hypothetical protein